MLSSRWDRFTLVVKGMTLRSIERRLEAADMARSYVAMMRDIPLDTITVEVIPEIGGGLDEVVTDARTAVRQAEEAQRDAAARSRTAARRLREKGLSGRDIAAVLRVSPQRVSQLLAQAKKDPPPAARGCTTEAVS